MTGRLSGRSYTRRRWLKTVLRSVAALAGAHSGAGLVRAASNGPSTLGFREISHGLDADLHVPAGYRAEAILRRTVRHDLIKEKMYDLAELEKLVC